jgi:P22 coat protein - gene protein 5
VANAFILPEKVVFAALGLLEREITLPALVWSEAFANFQGNRNDTITLRVPAYTTARTRTLRGGPAIVIDDIDETSVDVTLNTDIYKAVAITDAEMTLDIADFGMQILEPATHAVARGLEDVLANAMETATYEHNITVNPADPYPAFVEARRALNKSYVPVGQRFMAVGSNLEAKLLVSDRMSKFDGAGQIAETALAEATIGRMAGFQIVTHAALDPDTAIAGHKTAFALPMRAPVVPNGVTWGASQSWAGLSMRAIRDYDFANTRDRLLVNMFAGCSPILDKGTIDAHGRFVPSTTGLDPGIFVRAVKLTQPPEGPS